jgi:hypothetical protein
MYENLNLPYSDIKDGYFSTNDIVIGGSLCLKHNLAHQKTLDDKAATNLSLPSE